MKLFKNILFVVYIILTIFVILISSVLYKVSTDIQSSGYTTIGGTSYMLQTQNENVLNIPTNALVKFVKYESGYGVDDYIVCKDSDDKLMLGVVINYANDADYILYTIDTGDAVLELPRIYVLGKADNYSMFLGSVVSFNTSAVARTFCLIVPPTIMLVILAVMICIIIFKRHQDNENIHKEGSEEALYNVISKDTVAQDVPVQNEDKHRKTYVNPNSHIELLKYDWLKEVADKAMHEAESQQAQIEDDTEISHSVVKQIFGSDIKADDSEINTPKLEPEEEILGVKPFVPKEVITTEKKETVKKQPPKVEEKAKEKTHNENKTSETTKKKHSHNDDIINEMLEILNQTKQNNSDRN